jgi:hypothetical protein
VVQQQLCHGNMAILAFLRCKMQGCVAIAVLRGQKGWAFKESDTTAQKKGRESGCTRGCMSKRWPYPVLPVDACATLQK